MLSEKRRRFLHLYLKFGQPGFLNATQAAKLAGYSPKSAHVTGHRLLKVPEIDAAIERWFEEQRERGSKNTKDCW